MNGDTHGVSDIMMMRSQGVGEQMEFRREGIPDLAVIPYLKRKKVSLLNIFLNINISNIYIMKSSEFVSALRKM